MFQNAAIDVAIGLILMYLMLSLICTVVNEYIATKLDLRASTLEDALQKLIDDPGLLTNFYAHGMITASSRASATGSQSTLQAVVSAPNAVKSLIAAPAAAAGPVKTTHPSYLAGSTVALALMGVLLKQQNPPAPANFASIQAAINNLAVAPKLKDALQASLLQTSTLFDRAFRPGSTTRWTG